MASPRALLGSLILLPLLLLTIAACSKTEAPPLEGVIEKASAAAQEVTSYHFTWSITLSAEGIGEFDVGEIEGDYLAPDRAWVRAIPGEEQIIIGRKWYRRDSESSDWRVHDLSEGMLPAMGYGYFVDPQANLYNLTYPNEDVVWLSDEVIDGVDTWHYRRTVDLLEGRIEEIEAETDPAEKEMMQAILDSLIDVEITLEMEGWIGKDDFLVRQIRGVQSVKALSTDEIFEIAIPEGTRYTVMMTITLSDFNAPVEIEAPF